MSLMPDALVIAQVRGARFCCSLLSACALILAIPVASAQEQRISFEMAEQPLADALVAFADKTGMAALVDGELTSGLRASPVKGRLAPSEALRILLAGTGLSIRYAGTRAFTIGLANLQQAGATGRPARPVEQREYFYRVQNAVERVLCSRQDIRLGSYRAAFQMWLGQGGAVQAVHFLGSTGDETRDNAITNALANTNVASPPQDFPQPLTIVLKQRTFGDACAEVTGVSP